MLQGTLQTAQEQSELDHLNQCQTELMPENNKRKAIPWFITTSGGGEGVEEEEGENSTPSYAPVGVYSRE